MTRAVVKRTLQFVAGPNEHEFYACAAHLGELAAPGTGRANVSLFFSTPDRPLLPLASDEEEEEECWFCREGGQ